MPDQRFIQETERRLLALEKTVSKFEGMADHLHDCVEDAKTQVQALDEKLLGDGTGRKDKGGVLGDFRSDMNSLALKVFIAGAILLFFLGGGSPGNIKELFGLLPK